MKVKITTKQIYHKVVDTVVDIPDMEESNVSDYLIEHESIYTKEIYNKLKQTVYTEDQGEWRYDIADKNYGGHL